VITTLRLNSWSRTRRHVEIVLQTGLDPQRFLTQWYILRLRGMRSADRETIPVTASGSPIE